MKILIKKLIAWLIDRMIIVLSFAFLLFLSYGLYLSPSMFGTYVGGCVLGSSKNYEYVGYDILDLDIKISSLFFIANVIFCCTTLPLRSSIGERLLGFSIYNQDEGLATYLTIFKRIICFAIIFIALVFIRFSIGCSYLDISVAYFITNAILVAFCSKSFIDIFTFTKIRPRDKRNRIQNEQRSFEVLAEDIQCVKKNNLKEKSINRKPVFYLQRMSKYVFIAFSLLFIAYCAEQASVNFDQGKRNEILMNNITKHIYYPSVNMFVDSVFHEDDSKGLVDVDFFPVCKDSLEKVFLCTKTDKRRKLDHYETQMGTFYRTGKFVVTERHPSWRRILNYTTYAGLSHNFTNGFSSKETYNKEEDAIGYYEEVPYQREYKKAVYKSYTVATDYRIYVFKQKTDSLELSQYNHTSDGKIGSRWHYLSSPVNNIDVDIYRHAFYQNDCTYILEASSQKIRKEDLDFLNKCITQRDNRDVSFFKSHIVIVNVGDEIMMKGYLFVFGIILSLLSIVLLYWKWGCFRINKTATFLCCATFTGILINLWYYCSILHVFSESLPKEQNINEARIVILSIIFCGTPLLLYFTKKRTVPYTYDFIIPNCFVNVYKRIFNTSPKRKLFLSFVIYPWVIFMLMPFGIYILLITLGIVLCIILALIISKTIISFMNWVQKEEVLEIEYKDNSCDDIYVQ